MLSGQVFSLKNQLKIKVINMFNQMKPIRRLTLFLTLKRTIVITLFLGIYIFWRFVRESAFCDKRCMFEQLIYDHALNKVLSNDSQVDFYIDSFTFDSNMLTVEQLGLPKDRKVWSADTSTFEGLIVTIHALMASTIHPNSRYYKKATIWRIIRHTIREVEAILPLVSKDFKTPWGRNWYEFSITYPLFLVSATYMHRRLFQHYDEFMTRQLSSYIAHYFKDPENVSGMLSLGWKRDGPNAIMMAVPYIGGHLLMNDFNEHSTSMDYVRNYFTQKFVTTGDGFYPDGTFIFHSNLRAFGYITLPYDDFILVSKFMGVNKILNAIKLALEKTQHPAIPLQFGPWFGRTSKQTTNLFQFGKLGFFVFDHMRGVSAKTADWMISFNGQHPEICFYESDGNNYSWAQYWTMARRFMYKETYANIYKELLPYYPGIWSYGRRAIDIKSKTSTTDTFLPSSATCIISRLGDEAIGMYNKYAVNMTGSIFDVVELTLLTRNGIHCYYHIKPNLTQASSNTLTLGVQVDNLAVESNLVGEGSQYGKRFSKSSAFVYPGVLGKVKTDDIADPTDVNKTLTVLYIEPGIDQNRSECGFSHVHSESEHNELIVQPTIDRIETSTVCLMHFEQNSILVLYNKITKVAIVSKDMGPIYRTELSIDRSALDDIFEQGYVVQQSSVTGSSFKLNILNGDKYQAVISNATPKAVV